MTGSVLDAYPISIVVKKAVGISNRIQVWCSLFYGVPDTINMIIQDAVHFRPPPGSKTGKKGRIYYSSQVSNRPPTFVLFVNDESLFDENYVKYIEKHLRENIELDGTSVKIILRGKPNRKFK